MRIFIAAALVLVGCTCEDASSQALRGHGFSDIEWTGYSFFACSEDDTFSTGFRAKNARGETVEGTVCCGVFKNCTVRF
jgi:hypothetical protein